MSKKDRIEPKRLKGFRDYLPGVMAHRLFIMDHIRRIATLSGFQSIATPALEYQTTLLGQGGDETDKQVYRFRDHGDRDVALRFDLTVPFARFVAEHQGDLIFPFKKLQIGDVWRGENTQKGRYREFCQCDLDIIGVDSIQADIEVLATFQEVLTAIDCGPFTQLLGHRGVLSALLQATLRISGDEAEAAALIALDKLAKIGVESVTQLLEAVPTVDRSGVPRLLSILNEKTPDGETDLARVRAVLSQAGLATDGVDRLETIRNVVRSQAKTGRGRVVIDLAIARGLGYYTGVVFETTLDGLSGFGSISSGGRYNNLASRFTSRELPGVGGSIGLDRLVAALEETGRLPSQDKGPVLVAIATHDATEYGFNLVQRLRHAGIAAEVGLVPKLANQFKYADRRGAPLVVTVGSDEVQSQTFAVKDLRTGSEVRGLKLPQLEEDVARRL